MRATKRPLAWAERKQLVSAWHDQELTAAMHLNCGAVSQENKKC